MMKKSKLLLILLPIAMLTSCQAYSLSLLTEIGKEVPPASSDESPDDPDKDMVDDGVIGQNTLTIDTSTSFEVGSYTDGNYTNKYNGSLINEIDGVSFFHYRGVSGDANSFIKLLPFVHSKTDGTLPGAIYNDTVIKGITDIEVKYKGNSPTGNVMALKFGHDRVYDESRIRYTGANGEADENGFYSISFRVRKYDPNYFQIFTTDTQLYLSSISVKYTNSSSNINNNLKGSGDGKTRGTISPIYMKTPGETQGVAKDKNGQDKTYTYYTTEYVDEHREVTADSAQLDPIDVMNYYMLFRECPANYAYYSDDAWVNLVTNIYGSDSRRISQYYNWTNGYVNAIPYAGEPYYRELDISLDGTSSFVKRGVGRVVIFENSFTNYSGEHVCVYTDDHYGTFQEYLNNGSLSTRFNVQNNVTNCTYSYPDNYKNA